MAKSLRSRLQIKIWHLFLILSCVAAGLAINSRLGYQTADYQILEYSQRHGIRTFEYVVVESSSRVDEDSPVGKTSAICRQTLDVDDFELTELVSKIISVRYRSQPFLWISEQDDRLLAMKKADSLAKKILLSRTPAVGLDESEPISMSFSRWYW